VVWNGIFAREHRRAPLIDLCAASLAMVLFASMIGSRASAAEQGAPDERRACVPDVLKHCSEFIPDPNRITACLRQKLFDLSRACRVVMAGGRKD
jgi:hypothetical protein